MFHGKLVDALIYKQMAGRAGRKGVDALGESVLMCKPAERQKAGSLLNSRLKAVQSCLLGKNTMLLLQSWTNLLTHLNETNAFYRHPSVI